MVELSIPIRLRRAILLNDISLVKRIVKNHPQYLENPDYNDKNNTSLHLAAILGRLEIIKFLVDYGHDSIPADDSLLGFNAHPGISLNEHNSTPLHFAAANAHATCVAFLCSTFPQTINMQDNTSTTPLMFAARSATPCGIPQTCTSLIPPNPKPRSMSNHTLTEDTSTVAALLEYGADVAAVDNVGSTALHYASSWGNLKSFRLLVEYGASPMKKNNVGATPTDYALNGQTAMFCRGMVAEYLRQRRQNGEQVDEEEEEEHLQQQPEVNLDWQAGLDDLDEFMREQRELTPNSSEETNSDEFVEARSTSPSKPSMNGGSMRLVDGNVAYEDDDLTPMSNRKMKFPDLDEMMDGYDESD